MVDSSAPMPWIGLYAVVASMICLTALLADVVYSIRRRKIWFPCRYTSLNAASLTVLAVAVKFSMDLTTPMPGIEDQLVKYTSAVFLCISTAHFMPSLGSMSSRDMLLNLTALGILIVTLTVNVIIQVLTKMIIKEFKRIQLVIVVLTVYTFIILCSCALKVFTSKRYLECKYNELHKTISTEEPRGDDLMVFDGLRSRLKKYWVMAETGDPQFVMARSETTGVLFVICFLSYMSNGFILPTDLKTSSASDYKWSVYYVLLIHYFGIALCVIVSMGRSSVSLLQTIRNIRKYAISSISLEIKNYGIKRLVEWKKRPPPFQVRGQKLRKFIYDMRNLLLNIFIGSQIVIVVANKLLVPISIFGFICIMIMRPKSATTFAMIIPPTALVYFPFFRISKYLLILKRILLREPNVSEDTLDDEQELGNFILLLESETILAEYLTFINTRINSSIARGVKNQPRCLMELIDHNSTNFQGVLQFESDQVPQILIHNEPPNCWSLPISTLTSIMMALPSIQRDRKNRVLKSVVEGFKYVRLVEETLDVNKKMAISTIAADSAWILVELKRKWLDVDLQKFAMESGTSREALERLASKSEEILNRFLSTMEISPINLPDSVIIANSMYKITNTLLLLVHADQSSQTASIDAQLFEKLSAIVADILAACLSNLPHVILKKCSNSTIEEREKSIKDATHLLGETKGILSALKQLEIPNLSRDQLVYIDDWRALLGCTNRGVLDSTSSIDQNTTVVASSCEVRSDSLSSSTTEALETHEDHVESRVSGDTEENI